MNLAKTSRKFANTLHLFCNLCIGLTLCPRRAKKAAGEKPIAS